MISLMHAIYSDSLNDGILSLQTVNQQHTLRSQLY